jgi:cell wall-associated NlpC family hydrolase
MMITTDDILAAARQCLGTPFRHQGRLIAFGLDCAGVAIHVARQIGVGISTCPGTAARRPTASLSNRSTASPAWSASPDSPIAGDLLLMRFASDPQHLAICAGETIIHAYEAAGQCCEHRLSSLWAARIVRVYRFRGIA